jgi:FixJ family two-component response regulator
VDNESSGGNKLRIAVVDDDSGMCQALARLLRAAGFLPLTFTSGEAFLAAQAREPAVCVVLDLHMPGLSGFDVRRRLAESEPDLPAILITAHDEEPARREAEQTGFAAYLRKPFPKEALLDAIKLALARNPTT